MSLFRTLSGQRSRRYSCIIFYVRIRVFIIILTLSCKNWRRIDPSMIRQQLNWRENMPYSQHIILAMSTHRYLYNLLTIGTWQSSLLKFMKRILIIQEIGNEISIDFSDENSLIRFPTFWALGKVSVEEYTVLCWTTSDKFFLLLVTFLIFV